jgi:hypothetical protein
MFAGNFDLQSFQKIFNHYWQILNYKKVYLKKEKKNDYWGEEDCVGDADLDEDGLALLLVLFRDRCGLLLVMRCADFSAFF